MSSERYAVVSCHVERPLEDEVWARFSSLQARRPSGFAIAALLRPPDRGVGEDGAVWLGRAREAAARGPLGHHTHWTAPDHARPTNGATGERVLEEGRWMRDRGIEPTLFCGGGWYTDAEVAAACAELGYTDCTPRARRPSYLPAGEPWAELEVPASIALESGKALVALPTTHSLGDLARVLLRRQALPDVVHVYFHDTDLLHLGRRTLLRALLPALARNAGPVDANDLVRARLDALPRLAWVDVARS